MKNIFMSAIFLFGVLGLVMVFNPSQIVTAATNCLLCGSGSSVNYCKYCKGRTSQEEKNCRDAGCKITGTGSCPTAANYKVANPNGCD